jgi:hypothetical protein
MKGNGPQNNGFANFGAIACIALLWELWHDENNRN